MKRKITAILGAGLKESLARVQGTLERIPNSDILILSGNCAAKQMSECARELGYKGEIYVDELATDTYGNAGNIEKIISAYGNGVHELNVGTSSYHVPSVRLIFGKKFGKTPYPLKIIGLPSSSSSKGLMRHVVIETLSILQDIPAIYLCKVLERSDIYNKTLKRMKNIFFR